MGFEAGTIAILRALTLMKDEAVIKAKVDNLMDSVHEDKSKTVTLLCEALAARKDDTERKQKIIDMLEEISKYWKMLIEDREKLLLTISNLEMERDSLLNKRMDPGEIYGEALETEIEMRKRARLDLSPKVDDDMDELSLDK